MHFDYQFGPLRAEQMLAGDCPVAAVAALARVVCIPPHKNMGCTIPETAQKFAKRLLGGPQGRLFLLRNNSFAYFSVLG